MIWFVVYVVGALSYRYYVYIDTLKDYKFSSSAVGFGVLWFILLPLLSVFSAYEKIQFHKKIMEL